METTQKREHTTTISVEKKLAHEAKVQAAIQRSTIKQYTEDALREKLQKDRNEKKDQ
jgi:hypothetical protein